MTGTMAKKKETPRKPQRTKEVGIQFYTDRETADAFARYFADIPEDKRPVRRAVLEAMLRRFLTENGYWPPSAK